MMKRLLQMLLFFMVHHNFFMMALHNDQLIKFRPRDLVTPKRFDNMAKYIYAQCREWGVQSSWPTEIYIEQMRVQCNLRDKLSRKYSQTDFLKAFNNTLDSIKTNGFDARKSTVTVGSDDNIIDGAHRSTACVFYGCEFVEAKKINTKNVDSDSCWTSDTLRQRDKRGGLKENYLDAMALEYCILKKNTYIAVKFPECCNERSVDMRAMVDRYGTNVYEKKIQITPQGLTNLVHLLYPEGPAAIRKRQYFIDNKYIEVHVYLFEVTTEAHVQNFAHVVRQMTDSGSCALYINLGHQDTVTLAQSFFNTNSIHFLNHARPVNMYGFDQLIRDYRTFLQQKKLNPDFFCICGDAVQAAFGIKDCQRLELIAHHDNCIPASFIDGGLFCNKDEIIFNPANHFYYKGLKFEKLQRSISVDQPELRGLVEQSIGLGKNSSAKGAYGFVQSGLSALMRIGTII